MLEKRYSIFGGSLPLLPTAHKRYSLWKNGPSVDDHLWGSGIVRENTIIGRFQYANSNQWAGMNCMLSVHFDAQFHQHVGEDRAFLLENRIEVVFPAVGFNPP